MRNHLTNLKHLLIEEKLDALLVSSIPSIIYLTGYAGFSKEEREAFLVMTKNQNFIITDRRYSEAVHTIPSFTLIERDAKHPIHEILTDLVTKHHITRLGFEEHDLRVAEFLSFKKALRGEKIQLVPFQKEISGLRVVKTAEEIAAIEAACNLGDEAFSFALSKVKSGMSEKELAFEIEMYIKRHGANLSFRTIVAFGKNAAIPHHLTSDKRLETKDLILIDMGVVFHNYCSDMTRTVFFGKASAEQKKMYQTVLDAQQKAIDFLNTNYQIRNTSQKSVKASDMDNEAREYIISQGYASIPHSLGHGTGIEVHEGPTLAQTSKDIVTPGMVFSVEPGIYISGSGGVRIEDLVVLEKNGPRLLTKSPKALIEL